MMITMGIAINAGKPNKTAIMSAITIKSGPTRFKKLATCTII